MTEIDLTTQAGRNELAQLLKRGNRRGKYGNVRTATDAGTADSQAEANRWAELRLLEREGTITQLTFHPRYRLAAGVIYEADSSYVIDGTLVIEDVKGRTAPLTQAFRIKWRLLAEAQPTATLRIDRR